MVKIMCADSCKNLSNKKILITGAGRGLGFCFAQEAAKQGAKIVMAGLNSDALNKAVYKLRDQGFRVHGVQFNAADPDSIVQCAKQAADILGGLDGLINNAAVTDSGGKNMDELAIEKWDQVMQVNVRGTWLMTKACRPYLRASRNGAVVNLASDTALWGAPRLMAYVASKGAIIAMTRSMARELGEDNITVNAIAPGLVLCEATEYVPKERHQLYVDQRAIKREQLPQDVAGVALHLLSDGARFVTGQILPINGGFVMN